MNYRLIRNIQSRRRLFSVGVPLLFLAVFVLFHFYFPSFLGGLVTRIASPFWSAGHSVTGEVETFFAYFSSKVALQNEVTRLSEELRQADGLLLDRGILVQENEALKEQLGRTVHKSERIVGAVLVSPPRSPYDTVVLDIGEREGVLLGDKVLFGSTVLGTVSKVYAHTSLVEFFSTAGRKTSVVVLHEGRVIPVEATGQGGGEFTATLPKEAGVTVNDSVVIPEFSPLLFADIEAIDTTATDSFAVIRFKNPVSISSARFFQVEKTVREE